jgi:transglutaminase-like putative cysteine protease
MKRVDSIYRLNWLDFGLSMLASCLTVYSMGMGLNNAQAGYLLMGFVIVGSLFSFAVHTFTRPIVHAAGGVLFALAVGTAFVTADRLNNLLPNEGVPQQLMMAGALAWMLALGSFFQWRETSMIFQAVPTIALFGLVGTWDTFQAAPFAFFGFLLCFAALFARAHGRLMMRQADESGFAEEEPDAASLFDRLRGGPWRWMAGAEWAIASALVIILLSVLGAPVLQASVSGVSSAVAIQNLPRPPRQNNDRSAIPDPLSSQTGGNVNVGQGPRSLDNRIVFRTNLKDQLYLRMHTYDQFTGRGWRVVPNFRVQSQADAAYEDPNSLFNVSRRAISPSRTLAFRLRFEGQPYDSIPIPGELEEPFSGSSATTRPDGTVQNLSNYRDFMFNTWIPEGPPPAKAGSGLDPIYSDSQVVVSERVRQFAMDAVRGATNDYEKARMLKEAIERRVAYDLKAPAIPAGFNAVDYFLFESKRGYCDLFASAMATTARVVGLPARYATGFYPARDIKDEFGYILHQSEAHAWAEIFFEGHGWVAFDPTEGAPNLGDSTRDAPLVEQPWVRTLGLILIGSILVVGPFVGAKYIAKRRAPVDPAKRALAKAYGVFVRAVEKGTGRPKRPGETPLEYVERVREGWVQQPDGLDALNQQFVAAFYSPKPANAEELMAAAKEFAKSARGRK